MIQKIPLRETVDSKPASLFCGTDGARRINSLLDQINSICNEPAKALKTQQLLSDLARTAEQIDLCKAEADTIYCALESARQRSLQEHSPGSGHSLPGAARSDLSWLEEQANKLKEARQLLDDMKKAHQGYSTLMARGQRKPTDSKTPSPARTRPPETDAPAARTRPPKTDAPASRAWPPKTDAPAASAFTPHSLEPESLQAFQHLLATLCITHPDITSDRLWNLLPAPAKKHPSPGRIARAGQRIAAWLQLAKARPESFPDDHFALANALASVKLYDPESVPAAGSAAFEDWVRDSAEQIEAERAALDAMKIWEPRLEPLMPEQEKFRHYLTEKSGSENILQGMPTRRFDFYRRRLREELHAYLQVFGPEQMNQKTLERLFTDCCDALLMDSARHDTHCRPRMTAWLEQQDSQKNLYEKQQFAWLDKKRHSYSLIAAPSDYFINYTDPASHDASAASEEDSGDKLRISIHPHDYEKAWPLVAEILSRNNCPFPDWKSVKPWQYRPGYVSRRFLMGGQFTLYRADHPQATENRRFAQGSVARTLQEIAALLQREGIRPGQSPFSDVSFGDRHPWFSYRFDRDRERQNYEAEDKVTHQRRREYRDEPFYQDIQKRLQ